MKHSYFDNSHLKYRLKKLSILGGMITSANQGLLFFIRLSSIFILARILTPSDFGLIGMVTSLTVLIERFQDFGLGDAIVQTKNINQEQVSTLFWINIFVCILLSIFVCLSSKAIAWFYAEERLVAITSVLSLNFIFSGLAIQHQALIRRQMRFDLFAIIQTVSILLSVIVAVVLALKGFSYWALVFKELARSIFNFILAWFFCSWRPGKPVRGSGVKSFLKFGYNVTGFNLLHFFSNNFDTVLIGKFIGATSLGLYSRAKQLTTIPVSQLLEPIRYISFPALGTLQNDPEKYKDYFIKMLGIIAFFYMPIIVYMINFPHQIILIALGQQWIDAVPLFTILALSMFFSPIVTLLGLNLLSIGYTRRYLFWGIFNSITISLSFAIGIKWGTVGISIAWPIATTINLFFSLCYVFKNTPLDIKCILQALYRPFIASIATGFILKFMHTFFIQFQLIFCLINSLIFGITTYLLLWLLFPGGYKQIYKYFSYPLSIFKNK
ncbi:MAG: lipopolysaccharide biosynthesis protein [Deltaproteobacteria bacterium]|nr:lipopolysaccharide biosynthesis protein [Deltaproteobacteria bacterium]